MMRSIYCLALILTNSVLAQAGDTGTVRINTQKWVTTYAGETEIDGLPVIATLDEAMPSLQIPEAVAGVDSMVPSVLPVVKKFYRLNLIVSHNPRIQTTYSVQPRTISISGAIRSALVSQIDQARDFQFIITQQADGSLQVSYSRKVSDGGLNKGDFVLAPVPHVLAK